MQVKCSESSFCRAWVEFLTPFHKLTKRERDVMARILQQYFKLEEQVESKELLRDVMWTEKSRKDMRESLGMQPAHFQMILARLRQVGVLNEDGDINRRFIPHKAEGESFGPKFILNVVFDMSSQTNQVNAAQ